MDNNEFASIRIGLASPEMIRNWSYGEVTRPETINYRTLKPEPGGLFCERIFGPTKDGACACGNYKKTHATGEKIICPKCGVEVTTKKVRRERMGHIDLASPVSHIWYFKGIPSRLSIVLDIKVKDLEKVIYYAENVVIKAPDNTEGLYPGRVLTEEEYNDYYEMFGSRMVVGMGAESVKILLRNLELDEDEIARREELEAIPAEKRSAEDNAELDRFARLSIERLAAKIREQLKTATAATKGKLIKRLEVIENFRKSGNRLDWMILDTVPVLPPDLRPMVQLDGGRFASSDLNELYRRVINRNNRLKKLIELKTPEIVIRNEKRMLQEAVDALIDNGKRGKPVTGPNNRTLKSLSEMLRGKQGRFRQNLLGKRVDYSGRSVIVVGPSLKIYQCGLPKEMALELFKPFVVKRLVEMNNANSVKDAQKKIDRAQTSNDEVWDALEVVIKEHPVLLNRAPTLHRLSIQAFEPVLVEGRAIKLHPLVCTAFNADFDGDQMPVHVPLSAEAQAEARFLMLSANNLLKPVDGRAVTVPTQDMILGSYYLTIVRTDEPGCGRAYRDPDEAMMAYSNGYLGLHAPIAVGYSDEKGNRGIIGLVSGENGRTVNTGKDAVTLGRLIFNKSIPQDLGFVDRSVPGNKLNLEISQIVTKKELGQIINSCIKHHSSAITAKMLDAIKEMGYKYSTKASFSISVYDMTVPKEKKSLIGEAESRVAKLQKDYERGKLSEQERYDNVIKVWNKTTDDVTKALQAGFSTYNPIKIMADSGARGSMTQMRQLAGMRGPMFATNGKTMEIPIKSNFREGMKIFEYFMGARSSRKSLSDTALRTADSGYLTRRLVDVSQEIIVREEKCRTDRGVKASAIFESDRDFTEYYPAQGAKLDGVYAFDDISDPATGEVLAVKKAKITSGMAAKITAAYAGYPELAVKVVPKALETLEDRLIGRFTLGEVKDRDGNVIAADDEMLMEAKVNSIIEAGIAEVYIRSVIQCRARYGVCAHCYGSDLANGRLVNIGEAVGIIAAQSIGEPGTQLTMRTFHSGGVAGSDITQGLPRVEELFEARTPKKPAVLSKTAGIAKVEHIQTENGQVDIVNVESGEPGESFRYQIPFGRRLIVEDGQRVEKGQPFTEGSKAPAEIMTLLGADEVYSYIITEVQKVYRAQSVNINDKHIEVIARQMTRKVRVEDPGDSDILPDTVISINDYEDARADIARRNAEGERNEFGEPLRDIIVNPILMGITKAALATESFMSAASFQETTKVLTDAAIKGKVDNLIGLKENVIIGKLIPAGTGMSCYRNIDVIPTGEGQPAPQESAEA